MKSFLDSCVVINFLEFGFGNTLLKKKCFDYISKEERFLFCFYTLGEIKTFIRKREIQLNEILRKKQDQSYQFGTNKETEFLKKSDFIFIEKLYDELKGFECSILNEKFEYQIRTIRLQFDLFLKNKISDISIKPLEVKKEILSVIYDFLGDYADCRILASAIQMQQNREQFLFVTADRHFSEGTYDYIKKDIRLKEYEKPVLLNLLYN